MQNIPPPPPGFVLEGQAAPPPPPRPSTQGSRQPRGIRNNNPGNIEDGPFARSLPGYAGSDGRFAIFNDPQAGTQAKTRLLGSYLNRGFDTPGEIINRWAPPSDNNPTDRYAQYVAGRVGVGVNDPVGPDQIPLLAQAIGEFENGQTQPVQQAQVPPPPPGFEMDAGDQAAPVQNAAPGTQANPLDLQSLRYEDEYAALKKGAWVTDKDGRTYQLPTDAWTGNPDASSVQQAGNVYQDYQTAGDTAMAGATAFTEQLPFADEAIAGLAGKLTGRGYDSIRDQQMMDREYFNDTQGLARDVGGLAGFGVGLAAPGASFIARGPSTAYRMSRAGAVGGGLGGVYAAGNSEGGLQERLASAGRGAAIGAATGGILQGGMERLSGLAQRAATRPSPARVLSREGVDLTPGQMAQSLPGIGPMLRGLEDGASSIPFVGAPIAGARQQSVESFNRAALNRAMQPLGERLPRNVQPGYESVEYAQQVVSRAYDDVLSQTRFVPDQQFYDDLGSSITRTLSDAGIPQSQTLTRQISDRVFRAMPEQGTPIEGSQFKALESEFGNLARQNLEAADGASRALGRSYQAVQEALRDGLRRQNPALADQLRDVNGAYARLMRVERAAASTASQANDGVFSPTQLGQAVGQMGSRRSSARGDALLQDLAVAGRSVIPSRVGDSGTATRGAITGLIGGAAMGVPVANTVAVPVIAASVAYSRPAQAALNAIYRASDRPGAAAEALSRLAGLARQNPALVPYYEAAVLRVQLGAQSQSQETGPRRAGLFGTTRPQTATQ